MLKNIKNIHTHVCEEDRKRLNKWSSLLVGEQVPLHVRCLFRLVGAEWAIMPNHILVVNIHLVFN